MMDQALAKKYARVLLEVGVDLKRGQNLFIQAPLEAHGLVQELTRLAYAEYGARHVKAFYVDAQQQELKARYAAEEYLSYVPKWEQEYLEKLSRKDCAFIKLHCVHNISSGVAPNRLTAAARADMELVKGYRRNMNAWRISWTSAIYPTEEWAELAYPELDQGAAFDALMRDFIKINRLDEADPVAKWKAFRDELAALCKKLDGLDIAALRFSSPTAELALDLVENGRWTGGAVYTADGKNHFMGNLPTAEVFHVPHKYGVNGRVKSTRPLNYNGSVIEDIDITFENGRVVKYGASKNEAVLKGILETDEGAKYLGEVALVPASSLINRTGRVFGTTLYDENAACHIALGNYCSLVTGNVEDEDEANARGITQSSLHVDFMIGSDELTVTALCRDGTRHTLMRRGEWTDEV